MLSIGQVVFTISCVEIQRTAPCLFRTFIAEKAVNGINKAKHSGYIIYTAGKNNELKFREISPGRYQTTDGFKPVFLSREEAENERLARIKQKGREAPGNSGDVDPDSRYRAHQQLIDEVADALGCTVIRPSGTEPGRTPQTALIYLPDDAEHNSAVDQEPVQYSRQEAAELEQATKKKVDPKYIYRDYLWFFQNTDSHGHCSPNFANLGQLDLRGDGWRSVIEGSIKLAYYENLQLCYAFGSGGYGMLREADNTYNDLNRQIIDAFYKRHGKAFMGCINLPEEKRKQLADSTVSVFEEYTGQPIYNFGCDFVVPVADKTLERLILDWNRGGYPNHQQLVSQIIDAVERIGGRHFLWY